MDRFAWTVDAQLRAHHAALEMRNYDPPSEIYDDDTSDPEHLLILCCDGLASDSRGRRVGDSSFSAIGAIMFIPAGLRIQAVASLERRARILRCRIDPNILTNETAQYGDWSHCPDGSIMNVRSPVVADSMRRLARETLAPGFASTIIVEGLASTALVEIYRLFGPANPNADSAPGTLPRAKLRQLSDYIEAHPGCPTLAELAQFCSLSTSHLRRLYKQTTGRTLYSDVDAMRADRARALLADSSLPLKEIAYRLGFSGTSNFSVAFRRSVGMSPGAFRRSLS